MSSMLSAYSATNHLPIHLSALVEPLSEEVTGNAGKALWLLFAAVIGLLLIACVNLASLQLARAVVRERDNGVRTALGGQPDSTIPGVLHGKRRSLFRRADRSAFCWHSAEFGSFAGIAPENLPRLHELHVTWPVLLFACGISGIAAMLSGTLPAMRSLHSNALRALQPASTRIFRSGQTPSIRKVLITFEIACTVVPRRSNIEPGEREHSVYGHARRSFYARLPSVENRPNEGPPI